MLQYTAISKTTLELLKALMQEVCLNEFNLVGGTALALHMGHRISIDLDLFTNSDFDTKFILNELRKKYQISGISESAFSLIQSIEFPVNSQNFVKVDIIKYPYKLIRPPLLIDGIRLLSVEDIVPMKLSAIGSRGSKKDFYDIYFLLRKYSFKEMFQLFEQKFPAVNYFHIIKSLTYFDDAENELNPNTIEKTTWISVKNEIEKQVKQVI